MIFCRYKDDQGTMGTLGIQEVSKLERKNKLFKCSMYVISHYFVQPNHFARSTPRGIQ